MFSYFRCSPDLVVIFFSLFRKYIRNPTYLSYTYRSFPHYKADGHLSESTPTVLLLIGGFKTPSLPRPHWHAIAPNTFIDYTTSVFFRLGSYYESIVSRRKSNNVWNSGKRGPRNCLDYLHPTLRKMSDNDATAAVRFVQSKNRIQRISFGIEGALQHFFSR